MLVECSCGKRLKVADKSVGKKVRCPSCKVLFIARGEPAEEEDVEEEVVKPARTKKRTLSPKRIATKTNGRDQRRRNAPRKSPFCKSTG